MVCKDNKENNILQQPQKPIQNTKNWLFIYSYFAILNNPWNFPTKTASCLGDKILQPQNFQFR